jgi:hypothetical protein
MFIKRIAIPLLIFSSCVYAGSENKRPAALYIKKTISDEETLYKFDFPDESIFWKTNIFWETYNVWRSAGGIDCSATVYSSEDRKLSGTYECKTPEGYKAQISFDCSKNNNQDSSAYLFFGLVGAKGNNGNFYVWCE